MVKIRKKRKPMSEEQRKAAGERLAKARAKRQAANPPQYKYIHESVLALTEDDPFYFRKVQGWIKTQKEELSIARRDLRSKIKGAEAFRVQEDEEIHVRGNRAFGKHLYAHKRLP